MPGNAIEQLIRTAWGDVRCSIDSRGAMCELHLLKQTQTHDASAKETAKPEAREPFARIAEQLGEYFAGKRRKFDIALAPAGTPFQLEVWRELQRVPYGMTITYSELARRIGKPEAVRAVGAANGANPIWIVVPCHRVIGADGSLTGYAGGIEVKRRLLELEGALPPRLFD